jgi:hypothetical protein
MSRQPAPTMLEFFGMLGRAGNVDTVAVEST